MDDKGEPANRDKAVSSICLRKVVGKEGKMSNLCFGNKKRPSSKNESKKGVYFLHYLFIIDMKHCKLDKIIHDTITSIIYTRVFLMFLHTNVVIYCTLR